MIKQFKDIDLLNEEIIAVDNIPCNQIPVINFIVAHTGYGIFPDLNLIPQIIFEESEPTFKSLMVTDGTITRTIIATEFVGGRPNDR